MEDEYGKSIWKGHYSLGSLDDGVKKGRVLDAGCGSGKYALPLRMRGFDVVGMDVSLTALQILRESSKARKIDIDILAGNVFNCLLRKILLILYGCYGVLQHLAIERKGICHKGICAHFENRWDHVHRSIRKKGYAIWWDRS